MPYFGDRTAGLDLLPDSRVKPRRAATDGQKAMDSHAELSQRAAFRFTLSCQVSYAVEGVTVRASLLDVSLEGVSVEDAEPRPPVGAQCRLKLHLGEEEEPIDLEVEVVRHTESGFAGQFVNLAGGSAIRLLDRIAEAAKRRIRAVVST